MKNTLFTIALLTLIVIPISAGRYAGDFMMIGTGVRPMGMGGAFAALANDGSAIYWNSAGIAQIREPEFSAMHAFLYNGLASYDNFSFCQPLPNGVTIGLNWTKLIVSEIPLFSESYLIGTNVDQRINNSAYHLPGIPDGKFNSVDDLFQFAFAKHVHYDANMGWLFFEVPFDLYFGGNVKYIRREIMDFLGKGIGLDFGFKLTTDMGVIFDLEELGEFDFGLNFQDIAGTDIVWDTKTEHRDEVLFNTKLGIAVRQPIPPLKSDLTLVYDYDYVYQGSNHYGVEWTYDKKGSLRAGYYDKNFTCGASVQVYGVNIDYALLTNPVGLTNRIGLRISF
ncbi:MAG: hypothetical protein Q8M98_04975 [Candidatus Cloacimonadaceae bacterium]|nr:hypothetical protein [Candidatus Cloacimonadaceae bacterium]